jgi:hypothetical protein
MQIFVFKFIILIDIILVSRFVLFAGDWLEINPISIVRITWQEI